MRNIYGIDINLTKEREELLIGGWESGRIRSMLQNIKEGDTIFDIGAEQGDITALLGKRSGKVVPFEPSPIMWPHIRLNLENNGLRPLSYYAGFASDITDENPKLIDYSDIDKNGFPTCAYNEKEDTRSFRHLNEQAIATKQIRIDDFCSRHNIYPDLITIDVEGSEWNVLKGMEKTIDTKMPLIYVSIHNDILYLRYGKWFHDIYWEYLREFGYKVSFLGHDHESHFVFYKKSLIELKEIL